MQNRFLAVSMLIAGFSLAIAGCGKQRDDAGSGPFKLSYGDSIIYLKPAAGDYIVQPVDAIPGTYTAFPDGIEIDDNTGAINVSKSETGLRYRITHTSLSGDTTSTLVVLSGITFSDKFYILSNGDSIAPPIYNANPNKSLPVTGSVFDEGNIANSGGCIMKTDNGKINLAESIRSGIFGAAPRNDDQKEFEIRYRINDASGKTENKLKVLLYWYNTMADVPDYLWEILNDRQSQGVFLKNGNQTEQGLITARTSKIAKPRPPCVVIVDH